MQKCLNHRIYGKVYNKLAIVRILKLILEEPNIRTRYRGPLTYDISRISIGNRRLKDLVYGAEMSQ